MNSACGRLCAEVGNASRTLITALVAAGCTGIPPEKLVFVRIGAALDGARI